MIYLKFKRIMDVLLSLTALIILLPVFVIIAIAIKLDSEGPVFFRQKRVGKGKTYFYILKFRTMRKNAPSDIPTHLLENPEKYITRVGRFLRKASLDELPQLLNILMGHMSIIGPRPALWNQYDLIAERDKYGANDILPGLTGLAQISGRDELPIELKAKLDGIYAQNIGFIMDIKCFLATIYKVFRHEGVIEGSMGRLEYANTDVTKEKITK